MREGNGGRVQTTELEVVHTHEGVLRCRRISGRVLHCILNAKYHVLGDNGNGIIIIIKRISRAPIYHTRWQHRALYNYTNHTHTHTHTHTQYTHARARARAHTHTHTHSVGRGDGQGCEEQFRNNY